MKKPSDNIFQLVKSMTPAEKRYFKRHYASDQNTTTELFDFINAMNDYDEEIVKGHFANKVAKNLKVYKIQLNELILKSLVSYHQKKNVLSKIRIGLEEVDILIVKQLYEQAGDRLSKTKQVANKYQEFTYLLEIAQKEFQLFHMRHDHRGISKHPIFKEVRIYFENLKDHHTFLEVGHGLMDMTRNQNFKMLSEEEKAFVDELLNGDLLKKPKAQLSFRTQLSRNALLSFLYRLLNDDKGGYLVRKDNLELFEKYPQFKDTIPFHYIGVLRNYLNHCVILELWADLQSTLVEAYQFISKHKKMEVHLIHFYLIELEYNLHLEDFGAILETLEVKIKKHISKYKIGQERILGLVYPHLIIANMVFQNYGESQTYLRKLERIKPKLRDTLILFIRILELINHFESGDMFLIDRLMVSWQRKKKVGEYEISTTPFYIECLEFFKRLLRKPFEKVDHAKLFYKKLANYTDSKDLVYEAFKHHHLDKWLKSMAIRKSFGELVREGKNF